MLGALAVLAVAMVAGAHWAYVELGWGGYWAWDPVENGVLLPWLAGLALCHASLRTGGTGRGAARLAALTFGLGLFGAFLTRSGATGSVHSFAEAEAVGRGFLAMVAAVVVGWVVLELIRRGPVAAGEVARRFSRQQALAVGSGLLLALTGLVAVGTVVPVFGDGLVVGGRYFAFVTWPLALAVLGLVGVAVRVRDRTLAPAVALGRLLAPAVGGVPAAVLAWWWFDGPSLLAVSAAGLGGASAALITAELRQGGWRLASAAALVAHFGAAVLLVGVLAGTTSVHRSAVLDREQAVSVGGFTLRLEGIVTADPMGPGAAVRAEVGLWRDERRVATLRPYALVTEPAQRVSVAGLRSTPVEDVMVVLRAVGPDGASAVVDVHVRPLAAWVWWGGLLVAAGLALAAAGQTLPTSSGMKEEAAAAVKA
jgi:cytochrome c-type biogenesis protein CcmF